MPAKSNTKSKDKKQSAFMAPVQPSPELAAIVGSDPLPRTEITKGLWAYIKKHDLQNPKNKREIIPDEKLAKVFGGKDPINMFQMAKVVNNHVKPTK